MSSDWQYKEASRGELTPVEEYNPIKLNALPNGLSSDVGRPLRRFWFRSAVGVLSPLVIAGYFLAMWRIYVAPVDSAQQPFAVGPPGATYVYYSWFVAGVVGLNLSLYGMSGVEAGMLMDPAWAAKDAMTLVMHSDATWSGPGGWLKTAKRLVRLRKASGKSKLPSRLWFVLAVPSMLIFAAWPLSGLSFNMTSGFVRDFIRAAGPGPNVTGFAYANFNERNVGDAIDGAQVTWRFALGSRVPGQGVIYTPAGAAPIPGESLPKEDGVSRAFLTAQAENPIEGSSWGLALQYNCSIVSKMSEFTLVKFDKTVNFTEARTRLQGQSPDVSITMANTTYSDNLYGVVEFAFKQWPNASAMTALVAEDPLAMFTKTQACYFNQAENITGDYPGLDDEQTVVEMVLWQQLMPATFVNPAPKYNTSVDVNITELFGVYNYREFAFPATNLSIPMTAIGARCTSSSNVGTADLDAARSTFSNFARTDTPINKQTNRCARRFGASSVSFMFSSLVGTFGATTTSTVQWLGQLFTSVAAPPPFYAAFSDDPIDQGTGTLVQLSYLQAADLRRSLLSAHAAYAVQLVYNGGQGFTAADGSRTVATNPNVTELRAGSVLTTGVIPVYVPAALFLAWALVVPILCAAYGFRRRWSPTLEGYSLFRFGVDMEKEARERIAEYSNAGEVEECLALNTLPGLVGDRRPEAWIGRIALVEGHVQAAKSKRYD